MKRLFIFFFSLLPLSLYSQPTGYYAGAYGKSGEALRDALYDIIKGHTVLSYTPGLWNAYYTTDKKPNGKLASIYSDVPGGVPPYEFILGSDQCSGSTPNTEGGCYNREHIWPQSKFGNATPMQTDLWLVYPTDSKVNSQRADWPYGTVSNATWTSQSGNKLGPNTYPGAPSGTAFEPLDSFKGDIARSYFYITTRYLADSNSFQNWEMANKSSLKPWAIQMLLAWSHLDPVSAKEKERNEAVYALQNNRNPFVDEPRFADCIWAGNCSGLGITASSKKALQVQCLPNPAHDHVQIDWQGLAPREVLALDVLDALGRIQFHSPNPENNMQIQVLNWPSGVYLLRLITLQGTSFQKLLID
ncbi:MAG: endonuclease [Bacteroidetes bacterium]|nr:endonuclease [Bacteroidota bacterium]